MKIKILLVILFINSIYCHYSCPKKLCGNYIIGSTCYDNWTETYINCMVYLNKNHNKIKECMNFFNNNEETKDPLNYISLNILTECKKKNSRNRNSTNPNIIQSIKQMLNAKCIYKYRKKLKNKNKNINCDLDNIK